MNPALIRSLHDLVGKSGLITDGTRLSTYEFDGLALMGRAPALVVLPGSTAETAGVLKLLSEAGLPVVPRGAGTGLTGGATPVEGGVVVSLSRMRRILELSAEDRLARVEAGLVNIDLSRAAAPFGLFYAPDPSSQQACTIGGNVANNSGGPHCFRYGCTNRHVRGLVFVDPSGDVHDLNHPGLDPAGLDLTGFIIGSEGTLGIVTEVTVQLTPLPEVTETLLAVYRDLDGACATVTEAIARRLEPSALEILDRLTIQAVEASVFKAGYPVEAEAVLLIDVDGTAIEVQERTAALLEVIDDHGGFDVRRATDAKQRRRLWAGRKGAFGAMGRIAPDLYVADAVVPRTKLRELVAYATGVCRERDLKLANVFHAGDGNLHPNICYDRRDADEVRRVLEAGELILTACVEAGGSLSGEHGIGLEKRDAMCTAFGQDDLDVMFAARAAFDPERRFNPGKLLPVRACIELRPQPHPSEPHPGAPSPRRPSPPGPAVDRGFSA